MTSTVLFGERPITIDDVWDISRATSSVALSAKPELIDRISRSARAVESALQRGESIYGVNTGYGDSCATNIPSDLVGELPLHLTRYHACGSGRVLDEVETRAIIATRIASLVQGWSGVRLELVQLMVELLRNDILPKIPAEGSVGASGDLTPLSYIAGALCGERHVRFRGKDKLSAEAFKDCGLTPIRLAPKEGLAVMNGTAVMTGLAVIAFKRSEYIAQLAARLTAMTSLALLGNPAHFDARLAAAKPHPGQVAVTARIREDLRPAADTPERSRLQDRYSVRCAPHVIGVLEDLLPTFRRLIETEINSANDNPLFDPEDGRILHGGHFYGGHIAFAMDGLKTLVANVADLLDRQLALLVDPKYSNGLPPNLSGSQGPRSAINHGLKAVQIAVSAWTAEALKLTMPASVFSRSTECHNQDKVSMGTISARDALRVVELTARVSAAHLIACSQALRIRIRDGALDARTIGPRLVKFLAETKPLIPFVDEDVALDVILDRVFDRISEGSLQLQ